ncbi:UDP-4-amino-4,6-dideoxy-N-acetyl-beta-L-altrosamine transaminase [Candidatus Uhrbacteria bacterium]|nr:UDP-4-amino-4,6-dideoxy-N-acetyl-beta-L-altrosamine transaminase [Candidatus Uhrbacteria bacterium]
MIPYSRQSIGEGDIAAVVEVLRSDALVMGPKIAEFERALAAYCGTKEAVVFPNGTAALHAAYFAMGLKPGDEFITTPMTFASTSNTGIWQGGKPVFVDIDPATGNIDAAEIERHITERTKAIVPVDYAGTPADIPAIKEIAKRHHLVVLEDGCHSLGGSLGGRKIGSLADMTAFSFHPIKPMTMGDGGAVTTDNAEYAERMRMFRLSGIRKERFEHPSDGAWYYEMQELGLNYRVTDIHCALGLSQLKKLDRFIEARNRIVARYMEELREHPALEFVHLPDGARSGWHLFPIRLKGQWAGKRREVFDALRAAGIGVQVHYIPVYLHPYYERLGYARALCPNAEAFYAAEISLPVYPDLTDQDQTFVIATLRELLS